MQKIINRIQVLHTELANNALITDAKNLISAKIIMLANKLETNPQFNLSKLPFKEEEYQHIDTMFKDYLKSIIHDDIQYKYYDEITLNIKHNFVFLQHIIYYLVQQAYHNERNFFLLSEKENFKAKNFNDLIENHYLHLNITGYQITFKLVEHKFQVRLNDWLSWVLFAKEKTEHNSQLQAMPYDEIDEEMRYKLSGCTITSHLIKNQFHVNLIDTSRYIFSNTYQGNGLEILTHLENTDLTPYGQFIRELIMLIGGYYRHTQTDSKTNVITSNYYPRYQLGDSQTKIPFKVIDNPIREQSTQEKEAPQAKTSEDTTGSDNNKPVIDTSIDDQSEQSIVTYICPMRVTEVVPINGRMGSRTTELYKNIEVEHPSTGRSSVKVPWTYQVKKGDVISEADIQKDWSEDIKQELENFKESLREQRVKELAEEQKMREQALAKKRDETSQLSLYDNFDNLETKTQEKKKVKKEKSKKISLDKLGNFGGLLTAEIRDQLYKNHKKDPYGKQSKPVLKLFNIMSNMYWLLVSMDKDGIMYGMADLGQGDPEEGSVTIQEIDHVNKKHPFPIIERDITWHATANFNEYVTEAYNTQSLGQAIRNIDSNSRKDERNVA